MIETVILAAGKGTRMRSALPKVMHPLAGKPLIQHVIDSVRALNTDKNHIVLGHGADVVEQSLSAPDLQFVRQTEQLGTGHAVQQTLPFLADDSLVLILYGDVPLISTETLQRLLAEVTETSMALLTVTLENPFGYGRIVRNDANTVTGIVEQKDASEHQLQINEVNTGVMAIRAADLKAWLPKIDNKNAQQEYYLTDIVSLAVEHGSAVTAVSASNEYEVMGINNRSQQAQLERKLQSLQAEKLMEQGVTLMDPSRIDIRGVLQCGEDCVIDINCLFEGEVTLGNNVHIGPNSVIKNTRIKDGTVIHANTVVEDADIGAACNIGPFARVRPGSVYADGVKVGNFVETKKVNVGLGTKINHLSYVGDAELGDNVNVGAGTITCNYDGVNKHLTKIENNVFVGSNTAIVAPVNVASGSTIAAGSVITKNIEEKQLAIARGKQANIDGWKRPEKKT